MLPLSWEKIHVPTKKQIYEGIFQIMENRKVMSNFARNRALELFDFKYGSKTRRGV